MIAGRNFPPLRTKYDRISCDTSHKNNISLSPGEFLIKLKHYLNRYLSDVPNFSTVSLLALNKLHLKNTVVLLQNNVNDATNYTFYTFCQ